MGGNSFRRLHTLLSYVYLQAVVGYGQLVPRSQMPKLRPPLGVGRGVREVYEIYILVTEWCCNDYNFPNPPVTP